MIMLPCLTAATYAWSAAKTSRISGSISTLQILSLKLLGSEGQRVRARARVRVRVRASEGRARAKAKARARARARVTARARVGCLA